MYLFLYSALVHITVILTCTNICTYTMYKSYVFFRTVMWDQSVGVRVKKFSNMVISYYACSHIYEETVIPREHF